ncbi:hypothetical protein K523DRAFT_319185 [Schizophyllum commune Tattone D]|nr:hypothetical protein K523DRAFT_319185 [Schizophyllum commune Tattone D]
MPPGSAALEARQDGPAPSRRDPEGKSLTPTLSISQAAATTTRCQSSCLASHTYSYDEIEHNFASRQATPFPPLLQRCRIVTPYCHCPAQSACLHPRELRSSSTTCQYRAPDVAEWRA